MNRRQIRQKLLRVWPDGQYIVGDDSVDDSFEITDMVHIQIGCRLANAIVELDDEEFWLGPLRRTISAAIHDAQAQLEVH